ncbi:MAG: hypothetical protein EOO10_26110, partial [Chitinophagaceae bacterium]
MKFILLSLFLAISLLSFSQWQNVDSLYGPLPASVKVFVTTQRIDTAPFKAYYVIADLNDKSLDYTTDTTLDRRATPSQFYAKNNNPLLVVNGTFFSFQTNRNLNAVIRKGKLLAGNAQTVAGRGKDTLTYRHPVASAIGISKKRKADIAWLLTDSSAGHPISRQVPWQLLKDSVYNPPVQYLA